MPYWFVVMQQSNKNECDATTSPDTENIQCAVCMKPSIGAEPNLAEIRPNKYEHEWFH